MYTNLYKYDNISSWPGFCCKSGNKFNSFNFSLSARLVKPTLGSYVGKSLPFLTEYTVPIFDASLMCKQYTDGDSRKRKTEVNLRFMQKSYILK